MWELANAVGCCSSSEDNEPFETTIIVEDSDAVEFIEQIKRDPNGTKFIGGFADHLGKIKKSKSILHLIITCHHLVYISVSSDSFKRKAMSVDIYGESYEEMEGREDSVFYHVYPKESLVHSEQGVQWEKWRTVPLEELCDDFPVMDELDYSEIVDIDESGIIQINIISRASALSEFEKVNELNRSRTAIVKIDPCYPYQVKCEVIDR
jgi:hypothetical protein